MTQLFAQSMHRRRLLDVCCTNTNAAGGMSICLSSRADALVRSSHHVKAPLLQLRGKPVSFLQDHHSVLAATWHACLSPLMTPALLLQLHGGPVCLGS